MSMPDPMSSALAEFMTVVTHVRKAMQIIEGPYHELIRSGNEIFVNRLTWNGGLAPWQP